MGRKKRLTSKRAEKKNRESKSKNEDYDPVKFQSFAGTCCLYIRGREVTKQYDYYNVVC
jgi:hypothetical protein